MKKYISILLAMLMLLTAMGNLQLIAFADEYEGYDDIYHEDSIFLPFSEVTLEVDDELYQRGYIVIPVINFTLEVGMVYQISAYIYPLDTESQVVIWSSSDESVATISSNGTVTAISEGTAILTATTPDGDLSEISTVFVIPAEAPYEEEFAGVVPFNSLPTNINVVPFSLTIRVGEFGFFNAAPVPAGTQFNFGWSSNNTSVARVNRLDGSITGEVRGVAAGQATIIVNTPRQGGGFVSVNRLVTVQAVAPAAPTNLRATETTTNSIRLAWNAPPQGAASYYVYLNGSRLSGSVSTAGANITGLLPNTSYRFNVRARNSGGTSGLSGALNVSTRPAATRTLTFNAGTGATWSSAPSGWARNAAQTQLSRTVNSGIAWSTIQWPTSANLSRANHTPTIPARPTGSVPATGGTVSWTVTWRQNVTTPSAPTSVSATSGNGLATLHWQPPSNNGGAAIDGYQISSNGVNWLNVGSTVRSHTFNGLTNGTPVTLRVRAVNSAGNGSTASVMTTPIAATRTVTFNLNGGNIGGSTTNPTRQVANGSSVGTANMPANPNRANFTFAGWTSTSSMSTTVNFTGNTVVNANMTVWAVWTPVTVNRTVTFNLNGGNIGGSTTNPTRQVPNGSSVGTFNMPANPNRANFTFAGWTSTSSTSTTVNFTGNTVVNANMTVWAVWTPVTVNRTVTYNLQGGNIGGVTTNVTRTVNNNARLDTGTPLPAMPTPVRSGHNFVGWFTAATGGEQRHGSFIVTSNLTLHARWTPVTVTTFTVTYNANWPGGVAGTGSVPVDNNRYAAGATVTVRGNTGNLARTGYTFAGWRRGRTDGALDHVVTAGGTAVSPTTFYPMPPNNLTIYAAWDRVGSGNIYTVHVSRIRQDRTNWCWAAVVEMMTTFESTRTSNTNLIRTQEQIVRYTFNTTGLPNLTAGTEQMANALRMARRMACITTCGTACIMPCVPECVPECGPTCITPCVPECGPRCPPVCNPVCETSFSYVRHPALNMDNFEDVVVGPIRNNRPVAVACRGDEGPGHVYLIYEVRNTNIVRMIDPKDNRPNLALSNRTLIVDGFFCFASGRHVRGQGVVHYWQGGS